MSHIKPKDLYKRRDRYNKKIRGFHPLVDDLLDGKIDEELMEEVNEIYHDSDITKIHVEAALCSDSSYDKISEVLGIPADILELYHDWMYPIRELGLSYKIRHINKLPAGTGRTYKQYVHTEGLDYLVHLLGGKVEVSPTEIIKESMQTAYMKGKEARHSNISSESSKQARNWMRDGVQTALIVKNELGGADNYDAVAELSEKLQLVHGKDDAASAEDLGITLEP